MGRIKEWVLLEIKKTRLFFLLTIFAFLAFLGTSIYLLNLKDQNQRLKKELSLLQSEKESVTTLPTPTPRIIVDLSNKVSCIGEKPGWKLFKGSYYSFSFPETWSFKAIKADTGFTEAISLTSLSNNTQLQIGLKYDFPFGFGPEWITHKRRNIKVTVGNKIYEGEETLYTGDNKYPYSSIYVLLITEDIIVPYTDRTTGEKNELPLIFIFGNDYPLRDARVFKQENPETALEEYRKDEKIIFQILSTFKFNK